MLKHTNEDARISLNHRIRYSNQQSNYTVTEGESGTHFSNTGAGGVVVFTLPALKEGLEFWFHAAVLAQDLVVSSPDADTIVVFNDIAASQIAWNTSSEIAGGVFHVICDGTLWYVGEERNGDQTSVIAS